MHRCHTGLQKGQGRLSVHTRTTRSHHADQQEPTRTQLDRLWLDIHTAQQEHCVEATYRQEQQRLAILLLGNLSGGSLCVPQRGFRTVPGQPGILAIVDGTELHHSEPFKGTRYSLVAFVHNACERFNSYEVEQLESMGFRSHGCIVDRFRGYASSSAGSSSTARNSKTNPSKACPSVNVAPDQKRIVHVIEVCCAPDSP